MTRHRCFVLRNIFYSLERIPTPSCLTVPLLLTYKVSQEVLPICEEAYRCYIRSLEISKVFVWHSRCVMYRYSLVGEYVPAALHHVKLQREKQTVRISVKRHKTPYQSCCNTF